MSDLFGNNKALGSLLGKKRGMQDLFGDFGKKTLAGAPPDLSGPTFSTAGQGAPENVLPPPDAPAANRQAFSDEDMRTVGNYNGPAFATNHRYAWQLGDPISAAAGGPNRDHIGPTEHGMWRIDKRDPWNHTWVWWEGDTTGMSLYYNSKWGGEYARVDPDPDYLPDEPPATPESAAGAADDATEAFVADMQPYINQLDEWLKKLKDLEVPDIDTKDAVKALLDQLGAELTSAEQLERQTQAAIDAGFWTLNDDGDVEADLLGYQQAIAKSKDITRVPKYGGVARTELQQRQLQQARAADVNLAARMMGDVGGESFGRAMAATHDFTATIANQDLRRQMEVDNQNFERAMISFQAENAQLQAAVNRGALSATQWMDRRERAIMAEIESVYRNAQVQLQKFGAELSLIVANVDNVTKAAMTAMGIESTAYDIWQAEYDQLVQPILDQESLGWEGIDRSGSGDWEWLQAVAIAVIPILIEAGIEFLEGLGE